MLYLKMHVSDESLTISCQMFMLRVEGFRSAQLRAVYQLLDSDIVTAVGTLPDISCWCWGWQLGAFISFQILTLVLPAEVLSAVKCWCCQSRFSISCLMLTVYHRYLMLISYQLRLSMTYQMLMLSDTDAVSWRPYCQLSARYYCE
jgi:hypothetical protein